MTGAQINNLVITVAAGVISALIVDYIRNRNNPPPAPPIADNNQAWYSNFFGG